MNRTWTILMLTMGLAVLALPALAQTESIAGARVAMESAAAQGDMATVYSIANRIVIMQQAAASLTPQDLYAVGLAHAYLGSRAFDLALQSGMLTEQQAALAEKLRPQIPAMTATRPEQPKLLTVGRGEQIVLENYIVPGKTTIVDFTSEYCGPCRELAPRLEALSQRRDDIYVVKVDLNRPGHVGIDWQSPVARQFSLRSIPYLRIYGPNGQLQAEGAAARQQVTAWCEAR